MKFNLQLKRDLEKYSDYAIVVEGKKDVSSLKGLGFQKVYAIHEGGISLKERIEKIALLVGKKENVCILTDFDRKGKELYFILKREFGELGVHLDSTLRGILLKSNVSHIEGLYDFMKKVEGI